MYDNLPTRRSFEDDRRGYRRFNQSSQESTPSFDYGLHSRSFGAVGSSNESASRDDKAKIPRFALYFLCMVCCLTFVGLFGVLLTWLLPSAALFSQIMLGVTALGMIFAQALLAFSKAQTVQDILEQIFTNIKPMMTLLYFLWVDVLCFVIFGFSPTSISGYLVASTLNYVVFLFLNGVQGIEMPEYKKVVNTTILLSNTIVLSLSLTFIVLPLLGWHSLSTATIYGLCLFSIGITQFIRFIKNTKTSFVEKLAFFSRLPFMFAAFAWLAPSQFIAFLAPNPWLFTTFGLLTFFAEDLMVFERISSSNVHYKNKIKAQLAKQLFASFWIILISMVLGIILVHQSIWVSTLLPLAWTGSYAVSRSILMILLNSILVSVFIKYISTEKDRISAKHHLENVIIAGFFILIAYFNPTLMAGLTVFQEIFITLGWQCYINFRTLENRHPHKDIARVGIICFGLATFYSSIFSLLGMVYHGFGWVLYALCWTYPSTMISWLSQISISLFGVLSPFTLAVIFPPFSVMLLYNLNFIIRRRFNVGGHLISPEDLIFINRAIFFSTVGTLVLFAAIPVLSPSIGLMLAWLVLQFIIIQAVGYSLEEFSVRQIKRSPVYIDAFLHLVMTLLSINFFTFNATSLSLISKAFALLPISNSLIPLNMLVVIMLSLYLAQPDLLYKSDRSMNGQFKLCAKFFIGLIGLQLIAPAVFSWLSSPFNLVFFIVMPFLGSTSLDKRSLKNKNVESLILEPIIVIFLAIAETHATRLVLAGLLAYTGIHGAPILMQTLLQSIGLTLPNFAIMPVVFVLAAYATLRCPPLDKNTFSRTHLLNFMRSTATLATLLFCCHLIFPKLLLSLAQIPGYLFGIALWDFLNISTSAVEHHHNQSTVTSQCLTMLLTPITHLYRKGRAYPAYYLVGAIFVAECMLPNGFISLLLPNAMVFNLFIALTGMLTMVRLMIRNTHKVLEVKLLSTSIQALLITAGAYALAQTLLPAYSSIFVCVVALTAVMQPAFVDDLSYGIINFLDLFNDSEFYSPNVYVLNFLLFAPMMIAFFQPTLFTFIGLNNWQLQLFALSGMAGLSLTRPSLGSLNSLKVVLLAWLNCYLLMLAVPSFGVWSAHHMAILAIGLFSNILLSNINAPDNHSLVMQALSSLSKPVRKINLWLANAFSRRSLWSLGVSTSVFAYFKPALALSILAHAGLSWPVSTFCMTTFISVLSVQTIAALVVVRWWFAQPSANPKLSQSVKLLLVVFLASLAITALGNICLSQVALQFLAHHSYLYLLPALCSTIPISVAVCHDKAASAAKKQSKPIKPNVAFSRSGYLCFTSRRQGIHDDVDNLPSATI